MPILKDLKNINPSTILVLVAFGLATYFELLEISAVLVVTFLGKKWLNQIIAADVKRILYPIKFSLITVVVGVLSGIFTFLLALVFSSNVGEYISYLHFGRLMVVSLLGTTALAGAQHQSNDTNIQSFSRQSLLVGLLVVFLFYFGNFERFIQASFPVDDLMDLTYDLSIILFYWVIYLLFISKSNVVVKKFGEQMTRLIQTALLLVILLSVDYLLLSWYLQSVYQTSVYSDYWVLEMPIKMGLIVVIGYFSSRQGRDTKQVKAIKFKAKAGRTTKLLSLNEILYFQVQYQNTYAITNTKEKMVIEESLSDLEEKLKASNFFRLNRQVLARRDAIQGFEPLDNRKLKAKLLNIPDLQADQEISRLRAPEFKRWMTK